MVEKTFGDGMKDDLNTIHSKMTFSFINIILIFVLAISSSNSQKSVLKNKSFISRLLELTEHETFLIMKKILLNVVRKSYPNYKKYSALIDDEDFERVSEHNWSVAKRGNTTYAVTYINGKLIYLHILIMGFKSVDHKDGDGLNCQRANLRKATKQQNNMNSKSQKNSLSRFKGVSWHIPTKKWRAYITHNYKTIHLGLFTSEIEAAKVYNEHAEKLFKEFAYLNGVA